MMQFLHEYHNYLTVQITPKINKEEDLSLSFVSESIYCPTNLPNTTTNCEAMYINGNFLLSKNIPIPKV